MKRLLTTVTLAALLVAVTGTAFAQTTVISGSDFNNGALVATYNGTYSANNGGIMQLAYTNANDDAVVGAIGSFGALSNVTSMSFAYSNLVGNNSDVPFAAFGVSVDGLWGGAAYRYDIISMNGNQLTGTSLVHVWDWNLNGGAGGDVAGLGQSDNVTLNDVLGVTSGYNNVTFGNMDVMRAYAYIGDSSATSGSNGMDPSSPNRHQSARLEVVSTSQQ